MTTPNAAAPPRSATELPTGRPARIAALVIRLAVGYLWFENLDWKRPPDFGSESRSGLWAFTHGALDYPVFSPFSRLIESVILPHYAIFGWGVYLAEISLGVFLSIGLATRAWALVGFAQSFVIYLTVGAQPHEWPWTYVLMMVAHLAVFALAAGRVGGVDAVLRRRYWPEPPSTALRWLVRAT